MTRHAVIGTAGHVDHGKTSLVKMLTGVDCDRLAEEKRRGITIELGFAHWKLSDELTASVVDVPGHERFVQTMVAGATGLDLVMLVVAADDGVMPQTREHLSICELLGVEAGVIAATKADLVDDDMIGLVIDEIREVTARGPLARAEIVVCSSRDGRGGDALTAAVARALDARKRAVASGPPMLAIDRVFSKPGFGTVVTGTLGRGAIATGDVLEVVPASGGGDVRVRGVFVHDVEVERVTATTRVALNLRGNGEPALVRGALVTEAGWQRPTELLDVELELLPDAAPLRRRRSEMVLHVGTAHATVRAQPIAPPELRPGERGVVRLRTSAPLAAVAGQRFILRRPELASRRTVGGGVILDPHPRATRRLGRVAPLSCVTPADLGARVLAAVTESPGGVGLDAVRERLRPEEQGDAEAALDRLVTTRQLVADATGSARRFFARSHLDETKRLFVEALGAFHRAHPTLLGATAPEIEGRLPEHLRPLAAHALAELVREQAVTGDERARLPGHDPRTVHDRIAEAYAARGLVPDTDALMQRALGLTERAFRDAVNDLRRDGRLHRLAEGLHVHASALEAATVRVREHFAAHPTLSPVELKALFGLTRKYAVPLLEWLDARGVTRREGDLRVLRP